MATEDTEEIDGEARVESVVEGDLALVLEDIAPHQAWALAQLVKRFTFEDARRCAVDSEEAHIMIEAVLKLQRALDRAGVSPR